MADPIPAILADEYDWVERYLHAWAVAMHTDTIVEGYPDHSAGLGGSGYGGYKNVVEDWQEEAFDRSTAIIDMLMGHDSHVLTPAEKMALLHMKACAVFEFREPVEVIYQRARAKVGEKLRAADFG